MVADNPQTPRVTTDWLAAHAADPHVRALDASWHLPNSGRDPQAEFLAARIPGAAFFDVDALSDPRSDLPHMLPSAEAFAQAMGALGIGDEDLVVVYDASGLFSAARAWWMLRAFGHAAVAVLDGGLPRWRAEGRPIESGPPPAPAARRFTARAQPDAVATFASVRAGLAQGAIEVLDARPAGRFEGRQPEPRPGVRSGSIPGSKSLPASALVADGALRGDDELRAAFAATGLDPAKALVTSCGSGVSAAILNLACASLGWPAPALYDGSWTDWAARTKADRE